MTKPKKPKKRIVLRGWGWATDEGLSVNCEGNPFVWTNRADARRMREPHERVVKIEATYRILPNAGNRRSA